MFAEPVVQLRRWRRKETRVVIPGHHAAMNPESLYINTSGFRIQPCGLVWNDEHPHAARVLPPVQTSRARVTSGIGESLDRPDG